MENIKLKYNEVGKPHGDVVATYNVDFPSSLTFGEFVSKVVSENSSGNIDLGENFRWEELITYEYGKVAIKNENSYNNALPKRISSIHACKGRSGKDTIDYLVALKD